ncbi:MAG: Ig-like domain-containing protein [Desulfobacter postgatei]|uniref:Ig-like domain-containing protein n=1 Tax=Desulfobacter postgatei TaxID=2293 RepID=UPI0023F115DC|nr:Ig-like domain-containing protein [Desulfobacter postgatei]MDD4272150.1 Ig-like domain-containing protein [Desulfobacter postgatei]
MAGEERINMSTWNSRLNYFDGLFLKAEDFTLEQFFHLMARRYLNYLLFNPGRLYTADGTMPLKVTASGTTITVSSGTALVRYDGDADNRAGHEVHLETSVDLDLATSTYGFSVNDTVYVRIDYRETEEIVGAGGGGAGVFVASANQVREQAVIKLSTVPPDDLPPDDYSVLLATVDYQAAMTNSNVTNDETRGGIRYEILSSDLLSKIGGVGPSATLTGITIDATGPLALSLGASQTLSATGTFSDSSTRSLTVAGDGLVWSSADVTVVSVTTGGTITAAGPGSAVITAHAGGQSATITVNVVTLVDFTISPGTLNLTIGDTATLTATGQFSDGSSRVLTAGDGVSWVSEDPSVATVSSSGLVTAVSVGNIQIAGSVDGNSHSVSLAVNPVAANPQISNVIPPAFTGQATGNFVDLTGQELRDPLLAPSVPAVGTTIRIVGPGGDSPVTNVITRPDSGGLQVVRFRMPPRITGWAANQSVEIELTFNGGTDTLSYRYDDD